MFLVSDMTQQKLQESGYREGTMDLWGKESLQGNKDRKYMLMEK